MYYDGFHSFRFGDYPGLPITAPPLIEFLK